MMSQVSNPLGFLLYVPSSFSSPFSMIPSTASSLIQPSVPTHKNERYYPLIQQLCELSCQVVDENKSGVMYEVRRSNYYLLRIQLLRFLLHTYKREQKDPRLTHRPLSTYPVLSTTRVKDVDAEDTYSLLNTISRTPTLVSFSIPRYNKTYLISFIPYLECISKYKKYNEETLQKNFIKYINNAKQHCLNALEKEMLLNKKEEDQANEIVYIYPKDFQFSTYETRDAEETQTLAQQIATVPLSYTPKFYPSISSPLSLLEYYKEKYTRDVYMHQHPTYKPTYFELSCLFDYIERSVVHQVFDIELIANTES